MYDISGNTLSIPILLSKWAVLKGKRGNIRTENGMENTESRFLQKCWHRKAFKTQSDESIMMYNVLLDSTLICHLQESCEVPVLNSTLKIRKARLWVAKEYSRWRVIGPGTFYTLCLILLNGLFPILEVAPGQSWQRGGKAVYVSHNPSMSFISKSF